MRPADRSGQVGGLDCCYEGWLAAAESGGPYLALDLAPADWRAAGAALAFLAEKVRDAGDRTNGGRLKDLAEKAEGIAAWCEGFVDSIRKLEEAPAELGEGDAEA